MAMVMNTSLSLSYSPAAAPATAYCNYNHVRLSLRPHPNIIFSESKSRRASKRRLAICSAITEKEVEERNRSSSSKSVDEVTRKFGLEAGLWKIFTSKEDGGKEKKKNQAKELLARYGGAYLATSISLSLMSFTACYLLITFGVDVQALLHKVGIDTNETGERVGTFALAYAAHKAASPIRFPPTVALTPVVANWFGKITKDKDMDTDKNKQDQEEKNQTP
uniref:TSA: Wollemia nobilis Ref_Wollemi_Transcript_4390_1318 transcribed RNA sequence n=1 Tax=Wollemia nobilis TaxID=56998 RepID=A0A0C9SA91_9CONI